MNKLTDAIKQLKNFIDKNFTHLSPSDLKTLKRELKQLEDKHIEQISSIS